MNYTIRRACLEDAAAIAHVHVQSWKTTYRGIVPDSYLDALEEESRAALWREMLAEGSLCFVAEGSMGVVGFADGGKLRAPVAGYDSGELYAIYLLQSAQGAGAGRMLVRAVAQALRTQGFESMVVWALAANHSAIEFYKRLGAVPIAETIFEIGGVGLPDLAFGWADLSSFA